jgi:predicted SnoaL-like aldol condensation-catalyzing enzyme
MVNGGTSHDGSFLTHPRAVTSRAAEGLFDNTPTSFYDFYRIVGRKMVEHWDVLEPLAPREQSKNPNGKF